MRGSNICVFVATAKSPRAAPIPSAPTSPMKILAGAAFHHRNPPHAPAIAAENTAKSRGLTRLYTSGLRKPQYAITVNARNPNNAEPAASPSRPSVTFTALVVAHTMMAVHTTHRTGDKFHPGKSDRVNERVSLMPVPASNHHIRPITMANVM